ncbi:aldo/keto reductase [Lacinutrix neustonica]|uniref:Aldo/keto reductase n=1 Tax=Lacinutrix neustonica TaxID=2980107 RepID=A0A9E8MTE6_9FLAO|nr:aldo/keto reductase [Lacinutrix neustonica]WAC01088.1 aldo/keto reductase [Lacinutrix neustonica]
MEKLKSTLNLSSITLGTMRFFDKALTTRAVVDLIEAAYNSGINTHHSSVEYSSYPLYTEAIKRTSCAKNIKHIVKLSAPHFEDTSFSAKLLEERVNQELVNLNVECIDVLQWLLRSKPINDLERLNTLKNSELEIEDCFLNLKQKGKIKSVFSFPYSVPFAEEVEKLSQIDGIISYLNRQEQEYSKFATNNPFIAIRPFYAGALLKNSDDIKKTIDDCLRYISTHKSLLTTIVGINSIQQLEAFNN